MDLDKLKDTWAQYDKKLTDNLKFNEEVFKQLNLDKSRREMNIPLNYELSSIIINLFAILLVPAWTFKVRGELLYVGSGILSWVGFVLMLVYALVKYRVLSKIDYYGDSILKVQEGISKIENIYLKYKTYEILLVPFFIIAALPLGLKVISGFEVVEMDVPVFIGCAIFAAVLSIPIMIWFNKHLYENKIKRTKTFLDKLKKFEEGE